MAVVELILDVKPVSYVASNPTLVLKDGEPIFLEDGTYAFGDNVTQLSALTFFGGSEGESGILSGGVITIGSYGGSGSDNDIRVAASVYRITGSGTFSASQTDFLDIALSSAGTQRYVGLYGTTSSTITKVEGTEAALATLPSTPANSVLIGYVLVTDAGVSSTPDLSGYMLISSKATTAEVLAGTNDTKYITPLSSRGVRLPRVGSTTSTATPSIDITLYDCYSITALATNITSVTITGAPSNFQPLIVRIKDNGTARSIAWGSSFEAKGTSLPTTTVINKVITVAFLYDTVTSKFGCVGSQQEA